MASMTKFEVDAKDYMMRKLRSQGYGTYAKLLNNYFFNVTRDPEVMGYMEPKTNTIVVNADLDEDQVALIIRHEIMHFYLRHAIRAVEHIVKARGLDVKNLDEMTAEDIDREIYGDDTFNWAADFDISNQAYTDKDKAIVRSMHALVTEDHHSDWVNLTMEEMYDRLKEERKNKQELVYGILDDPTTFVSYEGVAYGV